MRQHFPPPSAPSRGTRGIGLTLIAVAFAALARNATRILLGDTASGAPAIVVPITTAAALVVGVIASIALGITAGPRSDLLTTATNQVMR